MLVRCPRCFAQYDVPDSVVESGRKTRCASCGFVFLPGKEDAFEAATPSLSAYKRPAKRPPSLPSAFVLPEDEANDPFGLHEKISSVPDTEPDPFTPPPEEPPEETPEPSEPEASVPPEEEEPPVVEEEEAPEAEPTPEPEPIPEQEPEPEPLSSEEEAPSPEPEEPTPPEMPPENPLPAEGAPILPVLQASEKDRIEASVKAFPAIPFYVVMVFLILLLVFGSLWVGRSFLPEKIPALRSFYNTLGIQIEPLGLGLVFKDVDMQTISLEGGEFIEVKGKIINASAKVSIVPSVEISLLGRGTAPLDVLRIDSSGDALESGDSLPFSARLHRPKNEEVEDVKLTFVP